MSMISKLSFQEVINLQNNIKQLEGRYTTLADAAQQYMSILYDELKESIILTRIFATIPYHDLPELNKEFVIKLAQSKGIAKELKADTLVLSLLGSRGVKPEWNDRFSSKGHLGIPMISSDFIKNIPMMSSLLKQLGAAIECLDETDTKYVANVFKNVSGVFYVKDAETEVDYQGRKIIPAQDFVKQEKVKTVFGIGGFYIKTSLFFSNIIFLRECIEKEMAENFMLQASKFKIATTGLVVRGRIFD